MSKRYIDVTSLNNNTDDGGEDKVHEFEVYDSTYPSDGITLEGWIEVYCINPKFPKMAWIRFHIPDHERNNL